MKELELDGLSLEEAINIDGGFVYGFNWGMFWSGAKVGLGVGGAIGVAYYFMKT